jgi:MFS transporter, AAHS family, 4-hydroxybenzoate transporter
MANPDLTDRTVTNGTTTAGVRTLTVGEIIDRSPLSAYQIWMIVLCGMLLILDGYDALTMGYLTAPISAATHIPVHSFGPILSASLFGLMLAAMGSGPIADRWGRKWPVIVSVIVFGIFAALTARAHTYEQLLVYRFLTGLGLGGAMPNVVAIASEYAPKRKMTVIVALLFAGMPLGGLICGLVSSALIPTWGWQWVFYLGGYVPVAIALALIFVLPESVRFLVLWRRDLDKVRKTLARISPGVAAGKIEISLETDKKSKGVPVMQLFTEGRAVATLLLWIPNFMNLLLLYFINSWLPALLRESGLSVSAGVRATAATGLGGMIACLMEGYLINAWGAYTVLIAEFGFGAVSMALLGYVARSFGLAAAVAFVLGFLVIGAQGGLNALAARFYPTSMRSTGVGWALGVGRVGSVVGPLLAGILLTAGWKPRQLLLGGGLAAVCACLAIIGSKLARGGTTAYSAPELGFPEA